MKPRVVIPADDPPQLGGSPHLDRLAEVAEVVLHPTRPTDVADKIRRCQGAVCMINSRSHVHWRGEVLSQLPDLRMISTCGIGTDAIDLETCRARKIIVSNIPALTAPIVAEHALGLLLAVAKRAHAQTADMKQGIWSAGSNVFLRGKTLGILGVGSIGAAMAQLGNALGMRVIAWTYHPDADRAKQLNLQFVSLEELLAQSDALSLHLKLTPQSRGILGRKEIALIKRGCIVVNTARGALIDTDALVDALQSGQLFGAGLDVFDVEPLPKEHPLLRCPEVIVTPHNADQTPEGMDVLNGGAVDNVLAFLKGTPRNVVA